MVMSMIRIGTLESAQANRRHLTLANGTGYWRSDFIASPSSQTWTPQAFLVEQDPGTVILPHFHQRDEFQVVVAGDGGFGRHGVRPVGVHYAGRHTGYGPITAGPQGLSYFSLRAVSDPGARFLPESRSEMQPLPKRHLLAEPVQAATSDALRSVREPAVQAIVQEQDGIAAWILRVPPRGSLRPPEPAGLGPRFYLATAGELHWEQAILPRMAVVFVSADESGFELRAGEQGVEVLAVQFPVDTLRASFDALRAS